MPTPTPNRSKLAALIGAPAAAAVMLCVPRFEGEILRGYKDPIGIVTACVGHTRTAVLGKPYTHEQCQALLESDLAETAQGVMACTHYPLTTGQKAAFTSFAFNVGYPAYCRSGVARKANAGDVEGSCAELSKWVYAGGHVLPGLVKRRETERAMCEGKA